MAQSEKYTVPKGRVLSRSHLSKSVMKLVNIMPYRSGAGLCYLFFVFLDPKSMRTVSFPSSVIKQISPYTNFLIGRIYWLFLENNPFFRVPVLHSLSEMDL
jgi:hypothetical protein